MGLVQRVRDISARIGTNTFAVAVFEAMFVIITVIRQVTRFTCRIMGQVIKFSRYIKDRSTSFHLPYNETGQVTRFTCRIIGKVTRFNC
jgi:hypothetical protein